MPLNLSQNLGSRFPWKEGKTQWTVTDSSWRVYWRSIQTMSWWILWTNRINAPTLTSLITLNNRNHDIILYPVTYPSFTPSPPNQNLAMSLQRAKTLALHRVQFTSKQTLLLKQAQGLQEQYLVLHDWAHLQNSTFAMHGTIRVVPRFCAGDFSNIQSLPQPSKGVRVRGNFNLSRL